MVLLLSVYSKNILINCGYHFISLVYAEGVVVEVALLLYLKVNYSQFAGYIILLSVSLNFVKLILVGTIYVPEYSNQKVLFRSGSYCKYLTVF